MKHKQLGSLLAIFLILSTFIVVGTAPATLTLAQGCTVIDTITVNLPATTFYGTVPTKAGRRYQMTLSGQFGINADSDAFWYLFGAFPGSDSGILQINNYRGTPTGYPAYQASHIYVVEGFGTGNVVTAFLNDSGSGWPVTMSVEVCEFPPDYVSPACTIVDYIEVDGASLTNTSTAITLTNGHTYDLYVVGQVATLPGYSNYDHVGDPYFSTPNDWATQISESMFEVDPLSYSTYTLLTTTYQTTHLYHAEVIGAGVPLEMNISFTYRGGFEVYICDSSITPTPGPTATPGPTLPPAVAENCITFDFTDSPYSSDWEANPVEGSVYADGEGWEAGTENPNIVVIQPTADFADRMDGFPMTSITITVDAYTPSLYALFMPQGAEDYISDEFEADATTYTIEMRRQPFSVFSLGVQATGAAPHIISVEICFELSRTAPEPAKSCTLLREENANFFTTNVWDKTGVDSGHLKIPPSGQDRGLQFVGSGGTFIQLRLAASHQYHVVFDYKVLYPADDNGALVYRFGGLEESISIANTTDLQTYTSEISHLPIEPESGTYLFEIEFVSPTSDPNLIISYVCIEDTTISNNEPTYRQCEECSYAPTNDFFADIGNILQYLLCVLRNIWECLIMAALDGIGRWLAGVLGYLVAGFFWLATIFSSGARYLLAWFFIALYYINQFLTNLAQSIINSAATATNSDGNIFSIVKAAYDWFIGMVTFVASVITNALSIIPRIVGAVYIMISGVFAGINNPGSYSVVIADEGLLNFISLAFYVLDSTIFEGPVWYLVPMVMAFVSWTVLLWTKRQLIKVAAPTSS